MPNDTYRNYSELRAAEREGEDFTVKIVRRDKAPLAVIAPHGGGIEPGTSEIAEAIADDGFSVALFAGTKSSGNKRLHVTSTNFDEPRCVELVKSTERAIAIHGEESGGSAVFLGGKDLVLGGQIRDALVAAGYTVKTHPNPELQGLSDANICNQCTTRAGVQLELSRGLRETFFRALHATGRKQPTAELARFAATVRQGIGLGTISAPQYGQLPSAPGD